MERRELGKKVERLGSDAGLGAAAYWAALVKVELVLVEVLEKNENEKEGERKGF